MIKHTIIRKLEHLWKAITDCAQVDPVINQELEMIQDGTVITWSVHDKGKIHVLSVVKETGGFRCAPHGPDQHRDDLWFHCDSADPLKQVLCAKAPLTYLIGRGAIIVCGSSSLTMGIIRLISLSLPYRFGMRKARRIVPMITEPVAFQRNRIRYLVQSISRKREVS